MSKLIVEFEKERATDVKICWEAEVHHFSTSKFLCTCGGDWKSQCCCLFGSHQELALHRDMQFGTDKRSSNLRFYDGSKMRIGVQPKKTQKEKQKSQKEDPLAELVECLTMEERVDTNTKKTLLDDH